MRLPALLLGVASALWALPTPEAYFGHPMGADRKLVDWADVVGYFNVLDEASDSLTVQELGPSTEGRPLILVTIADPRTIANLDRFRTVLSRLADPRATRPEVAERLAARGKPAIAITCSIHSNEVASTMTAVQFAYDLLTHDTPRHRAILANTILLLVPSLNPDGIDKVANWYRKWLGGPHEGAPMIELYHKYLGHDNNRDWYIFSQPETRLIVGKLHNAWRPQIVYDVHQMGQNGARIFIPPWIDPIDPNIDALIVQQVNAFGTNMAVDLTAAGKKGVLIHGIYDYYSPARHYQSYHGALRLLSESASARFASPVQVRPDKLDRKGRNYDATTRSWNFLEPWDGGEWRLGDIVENQLVTFESVLYSAALRRKDLLRNFYSIGRRVIERGEGRAYLVPLEQHDPNAATRLLQTLAFGDVEIERVLEDSPVGDPAAPSAKAGDRVIRLAQPYGAFANTLLDNREYPDLRTYPGGPPKPPYDATAHSLPLLMGVDVRPVEGEFRLPSEPVQAIRPVAGKVDPGDNLSLSARFSSSWIAVNRLLAEGVPVRRSAADGAFLVRADDGPRERLEALASELGIDFVDAGELVEGQSTLRVPRVAVYAGHVPSMDEGWTRWLLDRYEMPYVTVGNEDVRNGLTDRFEVLILPDARPEILEKGYSHQYGEGESIVPPQYLEGLGDPGAAALREFASSGGTILAFNRAAQYAASRLALPVENVVEGLTSGRFYGPGSILNVRTDPAHPLSYGMTEDSVVWFESGPVFRPRRRAGNQVRQVLRYPAREVLASGWLLGESYLANQAAVLDVPVDSGRVILFGIRPQYRGQSDVTFKLVFNGLYLSATQEPDRP